MITKSALGLILLTAAVACESTDPLEPPVPAEIVMLDGSGQSAPPGTELTESLRVQVTDTAGNPVPDVPVNWVVVTGGGTASPSTSATNAEGVASTAFTLGPAVGEHQVQAEAEGLAGSPVVFTATSESGSSTGLEVVGGGNNVPDRYSSDLWVHGNYAYTGTWGVRGRNRGNVLKVWSLDATGAPALVNSVTVPDIGTVSDVQVSDDGQILVLSGERGSEGGIFLYDLSDPANPSFRGSALNGSLGVHTVTLSRINGRQYAFAAGNLGVETAGPALLIYDVNDPSAPTLAHEEPIPPDYGVHDTFVRDGIAFVFAWNTGVIIYDVGNGIRGGSPERPVEISRLVTSANSVPGGPAVHNGWWFHNPVTGERRYLFIGQEGPGVIGSRSSGDIHVVDVSDLSNPREVASFRLEGAGAHNFWMDEDKQILYAAYYNGGVVALDVSGTLSGDLSERLLANNRPGGDSGTYTWGVQLANGWLYAIDMLTGLWQLNPE